MRSAVMFAGVLFACSLVQPAAAQTFRYDPGLFGQQKKVPNPPKVDWNWRPGAVPGPAQSAVICGMTMVPADPKVDPKMRVAPPENDTKYAMKVVPPTVCKAP
jgi:hypothetical protein